MFHEKNEIAARQSRQRFWFGVGGAVVGALIMLLILLGH